MISHTDSFPYRSNTLFIHCLFDGDHFTITDITRDWIICFNFLCCCVWLFCWAQQKFSHSSCLLLVSDVPVKRHKTRAWASLNQSYEEGLSAPVSLISKHKSCFRHNLFLCAILHCRQQHPLVRHYTWMNGQISEPRWKFNVPVEMWFWF